MWKGDVSEIFKIKIEISIQFKKKLSYQYDNFYVKHSNLIVYINNIILLTNIY